MVIFTLEAIVDRIPKTSKVNQLPQPVLLEMYTRKLNGDSNQAISDWLKAQYEFSITERQLWTIFKNSIPDAIMEMRKKPIPHSDESFIAHIQSLERVAEVQLERIKSQHWDELDQEGTQRFNPQTGEIEYSATNKNLNDSIRTYNSLIKTILDLKASVGLIRKQPDVIEIKTSMNTQTKAALDSIIRKALQTGPQLSKFIQENTGDVVDAEFTEHGGEDVEKADGHGEEVMEETK